MEKDRYDIVVIGAGPGGLTCALYATRAGFCVAVLDRGLPGGQMAMTEWIDNYPGFPEGISGTELSERMVNQAKRFGTELSYGNVLEITSNKEEGCYFDIKLDSGDIIKGQTIVIGTGAKPRTLGLDGEKRLHGRGVSYCAICDGNFFKGQQVCVIGGGDSAVQEAVYLSKLCEKVTLVHRRDRLRASQTLQDAALSRDNIDFVYNSQILDVVGEVKTEGVQVKDLETGVEKVIPCTGVFFYVGIFPQSDIVKDKVKLDEQGFIMTDENMETSWPRVYAVGDVRRPSNRQITTAVADGTTAALAIDTAIHNQPDRWR